MSHLTAARRGTATALGRGRTGMQAVWSGRRLVWGEVA